MCWLMLQTPSVSGWALHSKPGNADDNASQVDAQGQEDKFCQDMEVKHSVQIDDRQIALMRPVWDRVFLVFSSLCMHA